MVPNGLTPVYLFDLLSAHNPGRSLRSSNQRLLNVPRAKLKSLWHLIVVNCAVSALFYNLCCSEC